jgi:amino acid adenylation domain-containing protein
MRNIPPSNLDLSVDERELFLSLLAEEDIAFTPADEIPRRAASAGTPLSFAQQRLWFLDQLIPNSALYNVPIATRLQGPLELNALECSLNEIARRHEPLRTTFRAVAEQPVQSIEPAFPLPLSVFDIQNFRPEQREAEARRLAVEEAQRPFDLSHDLPLRARVLRLGEEDHVLLLTMHHICSDGWSMGVLVREIVTLYHAYSGGRPSPLADLPFQYADYAAWQREQMRGELFETQLNYWKQRFTTLPPMLNLPLDHPRPAASSQRGAMCAIKLSPSLLQSLTTLSQQQGVTLFMTLLAAFQALLARYTRQDDVAVASPIANRHRAELEGLIGFFVNTLVMRTDLSGNPSFTELLRRVREVALEAYAHQDLPFERLVEELQPERALSANPLFQVMMVLQNAPTESFAVSDLTLSVLSNECLTAKFDLTLFVEEQSNSLGVALEYSTDLFEADTIERMLDHYRKLLESITADPDARLYDLEILTTQEREQLLVEWNDTAITWETPSVLTLFEQQVERTPDAVAVEVGGVDSASQQLSFRELDNRANQLAQHLRKLGFGLESRAGLAMERSCELVIAILGVLKAGGAYVPLDPAYPAERINFMTSDAQCSIVLTRDSLAATATEIIEKPQVHVEPENVCFLIYTSGSTGRPKGVAMTHGALSNLINWQGTENGTPLRTLQFASPSFDVSFQEIFSTWCTGGTLLLVTEELRHDAKAMLRFMAERQVERAFMTFAYVQHLAEAYAETEPALGSLREIVTGGERLEITTQIVQLCERTGCRLHNHYGPSETHVVTSYSGYEVARWPTLPPVGRPLPNSQIYILDHTMQPVPVGVAGELCIGGECVSRGYWDRRGLTAEKYAPNPFRSARLYRTGDLARYRNDGQIEVLGRIDTQVKIRGFRVEPGEIEATLRKHPHVLQAAVVDKELRPGDRQLIAYIVANVDGAANSATLRDYLKTQLPDYMIPALWVMLDQLPLTASGKVHRSALPEPGIQQLRDTFEPPRTLVEQVLAGMWEQTLDLERVGRNHNFFSVGGHSLLATRIVSRIRDVFKVEMQVRNLFERPTIAELAEQIEELQQTSTVPAGQPIRTGARPEHVPLSYAQERLWVFDQLTPRSSVYNLPAAMYFDDGLNLWALEQSVNELVRRHESLRTTFSENAGEARQVIAPPQLPQLTLVDLGPLSKETCELEAERLTQDDAISPFDLSVGPLLRVRVVRLTNDRHLLLANMHHIVSDGWSIEIVLRELKTLYDSFAQGRPSPLDELDIQYADYALWQREWLRDEVLDTHLAYWRKQLSGAPARLKLETDRPRPTLRALKGAYQPLTFSREVSHELREFSRRESMTLFITLMAGFHAVLQRHTGQSDIIVGTALSGRNRIEVEPLIGFFVNLLPIRTSFAETTTFRDLVRQVREASLGAHAHQELPFGKLVAELQLESSFGSNPLFQACLTFQKVPQGNPQNVETRFDLEVYLDDTPAGVSGCLVYSPELFEQSFIDRLMQRFVRLIEKGTVEPDTPLPALQLMNDVEYRQVVHEWNQTTRPLPRDACIHEIFEAQAEQHPDAIAIEFEEQQISYAELDRCANRMAQQLRQEGVGPEVLVAVMLPRSTELIVALLAIAKAGGVCLPINLSDPPQRIQFILEEARVRVVLTPERVAALQAESVSALVSNVDSDNLAQLIYTSGSTGTPKGIGITHRNIVERFKDASHAAQNSEEIFLQFAPISFDASTYEIWTALLNGARLVVFPPHTPSMSELVEFVERSQITTMFLTTGLFHELADTNAASLCTVRQLLTGGDVLSASHLDKALAQFTGTRLANIYGPTETTVMCCVYAAPPERETATVPIGRPIANTRIYILNSSEPAGVGETGEIYIGGAGLGRGYLNRPDLTAERFVPNAFGPAPGQRLYRTGDVARYLDHGLIQFVGRADHQVKISGYRIEPAEIEAVLSQHPSVKAAVVLAKEVAAGDKRLVAYVVPEEGVAVRSEELKEFLKKSLPSYMVPASVITLEALPITTNGKLDRRGLPEPDLLRPELDHEYVPPRSLIEAELAVLWASVLNVDRVGVHDNFFHLGGHSLLAIRIVSRVRERFAIELPVRALFDSPTLAESAVRIEELMHSHTRLKAPPLVPRPTSEPAPLSFAQQRLWFLDQLLPNNHAYNIPAGLRLNGALNLPALEQSLSATVSRHEALRTNFVSVDGQPSQIIHTAQHQYLPIVNLARLTETEREVVVQQWALAASQRPFNLANDSLFRTWLFRLDEQKHILMAVMHHIISDGWSMEILNREVPQLYQAFSLCRPSTFPELPIQYADYARWQREWLQGEVLETQLAYWRNQLADSPPVLSLPTDRPRPSAMSLKGNSVTLKLPHALTQALLRLSQVENTSLFIALVAAFQILLSRYSRQNDISVGTPLTGRRWLETENLIGFFVNTVVLRTKLSGDLSFRGVLRRVREVVLDAQGHQDLPFERLVEELQPERTLSHGPLFQVMFVLQNVIRPAVEVGQLAFSEFDFDYGSEKSDLTFRIAIAAEELACSLSYSTDLFDRGTIEQFAGHWQTLLEAVTIDPEQLLRDIELLWPRERKQLISEWNSNVAEFPETLCLQELFDAQAERTPDATAVSLDEQRLSYGELRRRSNQLAHYLRQEGVGPDTPVAIYMERSLEMVVACLGVIKAGGAYLPIDVAHPRARVQYMLEDSGARAILTQEQVSDKLPLNLAPILCIDSEWSKVASESHTTPPLNIAPENLAYIIYTSGSTGGGTGVMVQHRSVVNLATWLRNRVYPQHDTTLRVSVNAPMIFDSSVKQLVQLLFGHELNIVPEEVRRDGEQLYEFLQSQAIDVLDCTPSQLRLLLASEFNKNGAQYPSLALIGGEAIYEDMWAQLSHHRQTTFFNVYGPTECTVDATAARIEPGARRPSIGRPIDNVQIFLLDANLQPVPISVEGELFIGGAGLARGYVGQPELTAGRFVPHPFSEQAGARLYRSGDLAHYRPDGTIEFMGRCDFQVKIRGHRIEPSEVEAVLLKHPRVRQAVVVDREFAAGDRRLIAYVVAEKNTNPSELSDYVKDNLPSYMAPAMWVTLDELPLTPNGKVDRAALVTPQLSTTPKLQGEYVAPRNVIEQQLVQIWEELFKVQPIGIIHDFFELGGHSLLMIMLTSRIQERLGKRVSVADVFRATTIEALARLISGILDEDSHHSSLVTLQMQGTHPPLFAPHATGGHVLCYNELARHLGDTQPFFGLQTPPLEKGQTTAAEIETMAATYIEAIRSVQPVGPYWLGGWSMGGVIAFEIARQLQQQRQEIALLALIDSRVPLEELSQPSAGEALYWFAREIGFFDDNLGIPTAETPVVYRKVERGLWQEAKVRGLVPSEMTLLEFLKLLNTFKVNFNAVHRYQPHEYDGRVVLLTAEKDQTDKVSAWEKLATRGVEHHVVPGDHFSILREPHVEILAERLRACLHQRHG